jgi:NADPH:quinone reductase-like Zn-dependent oxidoreductase
VNPVGAPIAWPVSARTEAALRQHAHRLYDHLSERPAIDLAGVAQTLASRATFAHRAVAIGHTGQELLAALRAVAEPSAGPAPAMLVAGEPVPGRTAFVFAGQGSQRTRMGRGLHATQPAFARALDQACERLDEHLGRRLGRGAIGLREVMFAEPGTPAARLLHDHTGYTQAALFAYQTALFRLLQTYGLAPDFLVGHSIGEVSAAHVAGVLSLDDAAALVAARGQLLHTLPDTGAMVAVEATEAELRPLIDRYATGGAAVSVAAYNSPTSTVVSGDHGPVRAVAGHFQAHGRRTVPLAVSRAFHSPHTDGILDEFRSVAETLTYHPPDITIVTGLTGKPADHHLQSAGHWTNHIREPVRFSDAIHYLHTHDTIAYLELTPRPTLGGLTHHNIPPTTTPILVAATSANPGRDEPTDLAVALAQMHTHRPDPIRWPRGAGRPVDLPTTPFQHDRYWLATRSSGPAPGSAGHPLAPTAVSVAGKDLTVLSGHIGLASHPWLADHAVAGAIVLPGTAFADLALHAAARVGCNLVEELTFEGALVLPATGSVEVQIGLDVPDDTGRRPLSILSRPVPPDGSTPASWTRHAAGVVSIEDSAPGEPAPEAWPPAGAVPMDVASVYAQLAAAGYAYGPAFRGLRAAWRVGDDICAEAALPEDLHPDAGRFGIHPTLLDVALQPFALTEMLAEDGAGQIRLPFSCSGIRLHARGATALRLRVHPTGPDRMRLTASDLTGHPVASIDSVTLRALDPGRMPAAPTASPETVYRVRWRPAPGGRSAPSTPPADWAVIGDAATNPAGAGVAVYPSPAALRDAVDRGRPAPSVLLVPVATSVGEHPDMARATVNTTLAQLQVLLADHMLVDSHAVFVTEAAVVAEPGDRVRDLGQAAVWGLVRTAQLEHPGRFTLLDVDGHRASRVALASAARSGLLQVALREGRLLVPQLMAATSTGDLRPPEGAPTWRLAATAAGSESLALLDWPRAREPLGPGQIRVRLRAAGLNFRDALLTLGIYPGRAELGLEGAGVVTEVAPDVAAPAPGERVMGLLRGLGPVSVTDHRLVAPIPDGWSFAEAATAPVAFLTALYALSDRARVRPGEHLLVHSGAGGVGLAALQLARHWGVRAYATASPHKWEALRALGLPESHLASSRTLEFERRFRAASGGHGMDVVLNALAGDFTDASLRLLARGGRFIEMGKTDVRDGRAVTATDPTASYQAFDLLEVAPDRLGSMLAELMPLFRSGTLRPLPVTAWDVREAPTAISHLSQAGHIGKVALTLPRPLEPDGTVLLTGGTGTLAAFAARHLAGAHGVRNLLLASRSGPAAVGADDLRVTLARLGAEATVVACDVADPHALAALLDGVPAERPLTGIIHCAGVLDDATVQALTPRQVDAVLRAKVDAAWHLHRLTRHLDLSIFVLFSSITGVLGSPGQANYAAANAALDALATHRHSLGLPALSLDWGLWDAGSGMSGRLTWTDRNRMHRLGIVPMSPAAALELFDTALGSSHPVLTLASLDPNAMRARADRLPPVLSDLARPAPRPAASQPGIARRLAGQEPAAQQRVLLELVRGHAASILGHIEPDAVRPHDTFKDLGFDSLTAIELRNRLATTTELRLPTTLTFDHPTPAALATHLVSQIAAALPARSGLAELDGFAQAVSQLPPDRLATALSQLPAERSDQLRARLRTLLLMLDGATGGDEALFAELDELLDPPRRADHHPEPHP